ncbi:MAG TPA: Gfo/Idh/MocA family oxidoreductase [Caulobacteraceae bacterium]|nr:Gfo/Idh/MocA family oxidoreductase [Caulobacteraceae bacterium]
MRGTLRAGVIGAGAFGGRHAAKYAAMEGVALAAVLDSHPERAALLAERFGAAARGDIESFLGAVDVVSVAAPAASHARLALACLAAGKPTYVEKPLALELDDADAIVAQAARQGLVLACGFQERVLIESVGLGALRRPLRLETRRAGPPTTRGLDVSVVLDLMSHDLDLALALGAGEPLAVEAEGSADEARAEIVFGTGLVANFAASRVAGTKERRLRLVYPAGEVELDLVANTVSGFAGAGLSASAPEDRLQASLQAFVAAVRGERDRPLATGEDGARALDLALAVEHALGR